MSPTSHRQEGWWFVTEQQWLGSSNPGEMLEWLRQPQSCTKPWYPSDRKLRLFACACRRCVPGLRWDDVSIGWKEMEKEFAFLIQLFDAEVRHLETAPPNEVIYKFRTAPPLSEADYQ